jgi:hypothetical protein
VSSARLLEGAVRAGNEVGLWHGGECGRLLSVLPVSPWRKRRLGDALRQRNMERTLPGEIRGPGGVVQQEQSASLMSVEEGCQERVEGLNHVARGTRSAMCCASDGHCPAVVNGGSQDFPVQRIRWGSAA